MTFDTKILGHGLLVCAMGLAAACGANEKSAAEPGMQAGPQGIAFPAGSRLVDLTHTMNAAMPYWPTAPSGFTLNEAFAGDTPGGFYFAVNVIGPMTEHLGTHMDAPVHFSKGGVTAEAVPLERLIAPAVVVDMTKAAAENPDAQLAVSDIEAFERDHGPIKAGEIVLVRTGWAARWPDRKSYYGDDKLGDATNMHFPGLSKEAAQALVDRRVAAVGIDSPSIDHGPSQDFIVHRVLLGADIVAFENLASLTEIPPRGAMVLALPMKVGGGSGGTLRAVAVLPP
jgi:kynurenine formamidase